jgi:hypothetical protein
MPPFVIYLKEWVKWMLLDSFIGLNWLFCGGWMLWWGKGMKGFDGISWVGAEAYGNFKFFIGGISLIT